MLHELENNTVKINLVVKLLILLFIILLVFSYIYKIEIFDNYVGFVLEKGGDYYVEVYVENNSSKFISNNQILIDNYNYNYEIIDVDSNNGIINIKIDIGEKYLRSNTYINIRQKNITSSLFSIIVQKLKKGINL